MEVSRTLLRGIWRTFSMASLTRRCLYPFSIRCVVNALERVLKNWHGFFSSSYIVPPLHKNYVTYWSGPNTAGNIPPSPHPRGLRELSVVTEMGAARHVLSLQREPHLSLFSLPTNKDDKDAYDITSPALLPISFI